MDQLTFIFIGRSGCGKGTQAKLLMEELKRRDPANEVFYLETGAKFREFVESGRFENPYSHKLARAIYDSGALQPEFLTVWIWADALIKKLTGHEHLIFDGTPRKLHEARVLHSAMEFYGRRKPFVIYLDVAREWATARLLARGRRDDANLTEINHRMDWFESEVLPTVAFYEKNPAYALCDIHGDRSIEEVHRDVVKAVFGEQ